MMNDRVPIRRRAPRALRTAVAWLAVLSLAPVGWSSASRAQYAQAPAPIERRPPQQQLHAGTAKQAQRTGLPRGEHLAEWMNQHRELTPQQQQQALDREPGFRELPPQTQQRMRERLSQLDAMSPEQRERVLARNEALERLTPEQRTEWRGAMAQLGSLPQDQRRAVAQTFRALRELPVEQRQSAFSTGRYGPPLNENQRGVLFNLLRVEPLMPPPAQGPISR